MSGNHRHLPDSKLNNAAYTFNRLRSEAYEIDRSTGEILGVKNEQVRQLYDDVLEGRKKPNAAAVEAGFRPERIAVRLDNMQSATNTLASRLTGDQLDDLIACLVDAPVTLAAPPTTAAPVARCWGAGWRVVPVGCADDHHDDPRPNSA